MRFIAALALAALGACGAAAPRCELPSYPAAHGAPFLWRVQKADAPGVVWLYGTIHTAGLADVPAGVWKTLAGATHFASELGDDEPDAKKFVELARLPFGKVLDQMLSTDDWWDLENAMRGAIKSEDLRHAKPWFAMIKLMAQVAPGPKPSMDQALAQRARKQGIPVDHLETWEEQLVALDAAVNLADLAETIHERKTIACSQARLQAAYAAIDEPTLTRTLRVRDDRLISVRNARWIPLLEKQFTTEGVTFVAVGLGHLLGDGGLPAMLARAGYTVTR